MSLAGVKAAVAQLRGDFPVQPPPPPPEWSTRLTQCDPPSTTQDWLFSCFCLPCAMASAKSDLEQSNSWYNFCCWTPCGVYSWIRHGYRIPGNCGDDMGYGVFCAPCAVRRIVTETRVKGTLPGTYGTNSAAWHTTLFGCTCCEFFEALLCPCTVTHAIRSFLQPSAAEDCCFDSLCIFPPAMYGQVRHAYNLVSDCPHVEDVFLPLVCFPCTLNQARKECEWHHQQAQPGVVRGIAAALGRPF